MRGCSRELVWMKAASSFKRASEKQRGKHMMMSRNVGGQRVVKSNNTEGMPSGALWEMRDNKRKVLLIWNERAIDRANLLTCCAPKPYGE